jgi:hypothetical protein
MPGHDIKLPKRVRETRLRVYVQGLDMAWCRDYTL